MKQNKKMDVAGTFLCKSLIAQLHICFGIND